MAQKWINNKKWRKEKGFQCGKSHHHDGYFISRETKIRFRIVLTKRIDRKRAQISLPLHHLRCWDTVMHPAQDLVYPLQNPEQNHMREKKMRIDRSMATFKYYSPYSEPKNKTRAQLVELVNWLHWPIQRKRGPEIARISMICWKCVRLSEQFFHLSHVSNSFMITVATVLDLVWPRRRVKKIHLTAQCKVTPVNDGVYSSKLPRHRSWAGSFEAIACSAQSTMKSGFVRTAFISPSQYIFSLGKNFLY